MRIPVRRLTPCALLLFAAVVFATGIGWGLPSRRPDPFLFGDRRPWGGAEIQALTRAAGERWDDPDRGADVAAGPGGRRVDGGGLGPGVWRGRPGRPEVNATDALRAQIVRRYRLFTYQPDEMITLMSLARMHPGQGDLDPKLYQYGGLWIYPVGALIKAAIVLHLAQGPAGSDPLAFYLDHPEAFGRFYVIARLYAAAWGLVGVWAVYRLVRLLVGGESLAAPAAAAALFALMPVTVNMAHEAKPHLPGATLVLLAVLAAAAWVRSGRRRDALAAGGLCGAAFGMVLSTLPVFLTLPLMTLLRPMAWGRRLAVALAAAGAGAGVYAVTNPYVVAHQLWHRQVFDSNVRNSTAMYHAGRPLAGLANEASLAAEGMTTPLAVAGLLGAAALAWRAVRVRRDRSPAEVSRRAAGLLLAAPALLIAAQFALIGAGKPGEFGRFLLVPDLFLMIEAVVAAQTFLFAHRPPAPKSVPPPRPTARTLGLVAVRTALAAGVSVSVAWGAWVYLSGFVADSRPETPRLREARALRAKLVSGEARKMAVAADPAPYCLPPVDLFRWKIVKVPALADVPAGGSAGPGGTADEEEPPAPGVLTPADVGVDVIVVPADRPAAVPGLFTARISWAAKPFHVRVAGGQ